MEIAAHMFEIENKPQVVDYHSLTGLLLLRNFESEMDDSNCSILWNNGQDTNKGAIGVLASKLISLESMCHEISVWDCEDISRRAWISAIRDTSKDWERSISYQLGPNADKDINNLDGTSFQKKQRTSSNIRTNERGSTSTTPSLSQILSRLKVRLKH